MMMHWLPPIGVISMTYTRPFTAKDFPLFERMKSAGMDFCELLVPEEGELDQVETGKAARDAGLFLLLAARVNLQRDNGGPTGDCSVHASTQIGDAGLSRSSVARGDVGGPLYGTPLVFAGRAPVPIDEKQREARVARVVEGLQRVGDYARQHNVRLAVEPLNRFETDFCNTARQAVDLIRCVGNPAVGIMLDTFHMNMEEDDLPQAIRQAAPHLIHFQANENHRGFLGTGHLDWPSICRALADSGYWGAITLEPFRRTDRRLSVPLAQWRPPSHNEDNDLAHSAALLRAVLHAARRA